MEDVSIILVLLLAVVVSGAAARILPLPIPRPLFQIVFGFALGLSGGLRVDLDPEIFFLLLVPPLLFLDGWRIQREQLRRDGAAILELALGLVFFTIFGIGFFIHWLIPAMPLAVAFALAAVLSPTDPIAVSAIARRVAIPKRMMHILEGELLFNDASGLICLRFGIAAALTGTFSPHEAILEFLWLALGGIAVGVVVTRAILYFKQRLSDYAGEESGSQIVVSLLMPFGAYICAEYLHCSGILAAATAGITMSFTEASSETTAMTRLRRGAVWDAVQFAADGVVFVLLGEQLPQMVASMVDSVRTTGHYHPVWLLAYAVLIALALMAIRFVWSWVSLSLTLFRANRRGVDRSWPNLRLVGATTLAGVRGAITLAGALTIPVVLADGSPLPARDLAVFLAAGVIVLSLLAASIGLPLLLRGLEMPPEPARNVEEDNARIAAAEAAIAEVERIQRKLTAEIPDSDIYATAASLIVDLYRGRIEARSKEGDAASAARHSEMIEGAVRLAAIRAERTAINEMLKSGRIGSETARKLVRELDLLEARHEG